MYYVFTDLIVRTRIGIHLTIFKRRQLHTFLINKFVYELVYISFHGKVCMYTRVLRIYV